MFKQFNIELEEKQKSIIIFSTILFVTFLLCLNIVKSGARKADNIRRNIEATSKNNAIRADIKDLTDKQRVHEAVFYRNLSQSALRTMITNIASDTGVDVISVKPMPREVIGSFSRESFEVNILSTFNKVGDFILKIESLKHITKIESMSIHTRTDPERPEATREAEKAKKAESDPLLSVSLVISAFSING
jgi:hypothetical protein